MFENRSTAICVEYIMVIKILFICQLRLQVVVGIGRIPWQYIYASLCAFSVRWLVGIFLLLHDLV